MTTRIRIAATLALVGCGGASESSPWDEVAPSATSGGSTANVPIESSVRSQAEYEQGVTTTASARAGSAPPAAPPEPMDAFSASEGDVDFDFEDDGTAGGSDMDAPPPPQRPRIAQATQPQAGTEEQAAQEATDAVQSPRLLVYTAGLVLAVHHVTERMDQIEALAREVGGYLSSRSDDKITIRVPAAKFDPVMQQIGEGGEVLARRVNVVDVGEQYRDMRLRIANLEAMRERVARLLTRADDVDTALRIEQELNRITLALEQLRGQLRHLSSQIAFSTITITFQPMEQLQVDRQFQLPFRWLRELGIDRLMRVR